jgi:polyphosphate kinase 2 (PPK2 family)
MAKLVKRVREFARNFRVDGGKKFRLKEFAPDETLGLKHGEGVKSLAAETLREEIELLSEMQDKLYAQDRWGLLLIFQAMDAAGKDGTIKHVMSGINPQGCQVSSTAPTTRRCLLSVFTRNFWRSRDSLPAS